MQEPAAEALGALAGKAADEIVLAGGIPPLVAMLTSGGEYEKASWGGPPSPCAPRP